MLDHPAMAARYRSLRAELRRRALRQHHRDRIQARLLQLMTAAHRGVLRHAKDRDEAQETPGASAPTARPDGAPWPL